MRMFEASHRLATVLLAMLAVSLASCAPTRGGSIAYDQPNFHAPDAPASTAVPATYLIAPGDTLTVIVFQAEALSREYPVDAAGNISMPLIGAVKAGGITTKALESQIATRLNERYMRNPNVTVAVKESTNRNVTVDGSVKAPGLYPVTGDLTLIQAVALARGTDEGANPRRVAIFRTIDGRRMAAAFDLTAIRRGESADPQVYAGDIVVVDGNRSGATLKTVLQSLPILALFRPY